MPPSLFWTRPQRCDIVLEATEASPAHCKAYAQLNSGLDVWVIEDISTKGTEYSDGKSRLTGISKKIVGGRVAAQGLYRIDVGHYVFAFWSPSVRTRDPSV